MLFAGNKYLLLKRITVWAVSAGRLEKLSLALTMAFLIISSTYVTECVSLKDPTIEGE
jgi:hypothetical protein